MTGRRVVIALGGNALLSRTMADTAEAIRASARVAAEVIAEIAALGWEVVITHGNGPQVGRILLQNEMAKDLTAPMPLGLAVPRAGQIGLLLVTAMHDVLARNGQQRPVVNILTLTRVRPATLPSITRPSPSGRTTTRQRHACWPGTADIA